MLMGGQKFATEFKAEIKKLIPHLTTSPVSSELLTNILMQLHFFEAFKNRVYLLSGILDKHKARLLGAIAEKKEIDVEEDFSSVFYSSTYYIIC